MDAKDFIIAKFVNRNGDEATIIKCQDESYYVVIPGVYPQNDYNYKTIKGAERWLKRWGFAKVA